MVCVSVEGFTTKTWTARVSASGHAPIMWPSFSAGDNIIRGSVHFRHWRGWRVHPSWRWRQYLFIILARPFPVLVCAWFFAGPESVCMFERICCYSCTSLHPVDNIWGMVIVRRIRQKIIRTVLCCCVYDSCAQWYAHTCELLIDRWFRFSLDLGLLSACFLPSCCCVVCFCFVRFVQETGLEKHFWNDLFCATGT